MRGVVPDLPSAFPLAHRLPAIYQEDEFLQRFLLAFDEALAPIINTLDNLGAYVDPHLAPEDFLEWLGDWVGVEPDDAWLPAQWRDVIAGSARMHRQRGTVAGVRAAVELAVGGTVEVIDSGGSRWSRTQDAEPPGSPDLGLHVRVTVPSAAAIDVRRLDAVVADVKPAHVPHSVEIVETSAAPSGSTG